MRILLIGGSDAYALPIKAALDAGGFEVAREDDGTASFDAVLTLSEAPAPVMIEIGDLAIDLIERRVRRAGRVIRLSPNEFAMLAYLARHPGRTVTRAELLKAVWHYRFDPGTNIVAVHMFRLRTKLGRGGKSGPIVSVKGGYRLGGD